MTGFEFYRITYLVAVVAFIILAGIIFHKIWKD